MFVKIQLTGTWKLFSNDVACDIKSERCKSFVMAGALQKGWNSSPEHVALKPRQSDQRGERNGSFVKIYFRV